MSETSILEAKTNFSRYVEAAEGGEVIIICRHNKPVAELRGIQHPAPPVQRTPGLLRDVFWSDEAFAPMTDAEVAEFFGE